jgi:hypothetical protein
MQFQGTLYQRYQIYVANCSGTPLSFDDWLNR